MYKKLILTALAFACLGVTYAADGQIVAPPTTTTAAPPTTTTAANATATAAKMTTTAATVAAKTAQEADTVVAKTATPKTVAETPTVAPATPSKVVATPVASTTTTTATATSVTSAAAATSAVTYPVVKSNIKPKVKRGEKFDRGLNVPASAFIKKGLWTTGIKASYSQYDMSEYKFLIIEDIGVDGYTLDLSAHLGYTFRDNMMIGARVGYDRTSIGLGSANLGVSDIELNLKDVSHLKHTYTGTLFYRYYMGLGQSQRFAFFTEVQLGLGGSQAKQNLSEENGMFEKSFNVSLGFTPGVAAFITNNLALEVSINLLGLNYKDVEQISNQVSVGHRTTSSLACKINLLSLGFGISFYL